MNRSRRHLLPVIFALVGTLVIGLRAIEGEGGEGLSKLTDREPVTVMEQEFVSAPRSPAADSSPATVLPVAEGTERSDASHSPTRGELRIFGRVVDRDGKPAPRTKVHAREGGPFGLANGEGLQIDRRASRIGRFSFLVEREGEYRLWAGGSKSTSKVSSLVIDANHREVEVELVLLEPRVIEGAVLDAEGEPVRYARVVAFVDVERQGIELPENITSVDHFGRFIARSAADGSFRIERLPVEGGPYTVHVSHEVRVRESYDTANGPRSRITMQPWVAHVDDVMPLVSRPQLILRPRDESDCSLRLQFLTEDGGELPEQVSIEVRHIGPNGGQYGSASVRCELDAAGVGRIHCVRPGARYELIASLSGIAGRPTLGPLVAVSGELATTMTLPGLFTATFEIRDVNKTLGDEIDVFARSLAPSGRSSSTHRVARSGDAWNLEFQLTAGEYKFRVEEDRHDGAFGGEPGELNSTVEVLSQEFTMPPRESAFTFDVP